MLASRVRALVSAAFEGCVSYADDEESAIRILDSYSYLDLCICDLAFATHQSPIATYLQTNFARARVVVVTGQDGSGNQRGDFPGGLELSFPQDEALFTSLCEETLFSLQLNRVAHFQVGSRVMSGSFCDQYDAFDTVLKRKVYVARIHPWASRDEQLRFQATTKSMARAKHDYVRSVYEAGVHDGSSYACLERFDFPSLGDLLERKASIDMQTAVRILSTTVSVLRFWDEKKFPHSPVNETNVFVSENDFIKLENCVDPALAFAPFVVEDLSAVANAIRLLLPKKQTPHLLDEILDNLAGPLQVSFETNLGKILVQLYDKLAPVTVANFLSYVTRNAYDGSIFHHVIKGFIVQGGCLYHDLTKIATDAPIKSESSNGYRNLRGTIAMARLKDDPDSASSQFIFNLVDNPQLDCSAESLGYAVFGKVIEGMDVVDQVACEAVKAQDLYFRPVNSVVISKVEKREASLEKIISDIQDMGEKIPLTPGSAPGNGATYVPGHAPGPLSLSSSLQKLSSSLKKLSKALNR